MTDNFTLVRPERAELQSFDAVVAMAVYEKDHLEWVTAAVNSIIQQSFTNYVFCIVVDGYVNDELSLFLSNAALQDERIILIHGQENRGLSTCMNYVIDWASSYQPKYFFRMDADDISAPDRFSAQISYLEKHPNVSILGAALTEINEQGVTVGSRKLPLKHKEIIRLLPRRCTLNHPTVVVRFNVFEQGFRYREDLLNTQDYFLWTELAASGFKFANLKRKLLQFRRVNDFYKRRGLSKSINEFKARLFAIKKLERASLANYSYAVLVLCLRLMPSFIVKLAYKLDRILLDKFIKH